MLQDKIFLGKPTYLLANNDKLNFIRKKTSNKFRKSFLVILVIKKYQQKGEIGNQDKNENLTFSLTTKLMRLL